MLHHILYVAEDQQIEKTSRSLVRFGAKPEAHEDLFVRCFHLSQGLPANHALKIHVLNSPHAITACLRSYPIDLLIYDERCTKDFAAVETIRQIHADLIQFGQHWGPDFVFPMSRTVVILKRHAGNPARSLDLGRYHVRNVYESPESTTKFIEWILSILTHSMVHEQNKVGMALAGGGIEGFLYQIGCIHALECAMDDRPLSSCEVYSGISSGSLCATMLANRIPSKEVIRAINQRSKILPNLTSRTLYNLAGKEITLRLIKESLRYAGLSPNAWLNKMFRLIPTGFFKPEGIKDFIEQAIEIYGGSNDFSKLDSKLIVGATDQDTFEHVIFGEKPWDQVAISEAVVASCALPPFFVPRIINGRHLIDGQITRTCNLDKVVDADCRLLIIIDPFKPMSTLVPGTVDKNGGIYTLIQMVKALVYTRFTLTLNQVTERYPDVDFMVFQPDDECAELMAGSPMRYMIRTKIIDLAFRGTLARLRERYHVYSKKFAKFGFRLKPIQDLNHLAANYDVFS